MKPNNHYTLTQITSTSMTPQLFLSPIAITQLSQHLNVSL